MAPSMMSAALALVLAVAPSEGFTAPLGRRARMTRGDVAMTVDVAAAEVPVSLPKGELMALLDTAGSVTAGNAFNRPEILEVLLKLEPMNPTPEPAYAEKLAGGWDLRYDAGFAAGLVDSPTREIALFVYAGGYAPSLLLELLKKLPGPLQSALEVKSVSITIADDLSVESTTEVTLPQGRSGELGFKSRLLAETPARLSESFSAVKAFDREIQLPGPLAFMRRFVISYLDEDLLIIRDESGKPEILTKKPLDTSTFAEAGDLDNAADVDRPEIDPFMADAIEDDVTPSDAA